VAKSIWGTLQHVNVWYVYIMTSMLMYFLLINKICHEGWYSDKVVGWCAFIYGN